MVARALEIGRCSLYWPFKRAIQEQQLVAAITEWHTVDNTLGHRRLALRMGISENRVRRIMRKHGIKACKKHTLERAT